MSLRDRLESLFAREPEDDLNDEWSPFANEEPDEYTKLDSDDTHVKDFRDAEAST